MKTFSVLLTLCGVASAQSVASVDAATQIAFQSWTNTNGFKVSLALPAAEGTDFIAQIQAPLKNGVGWAGISVGPAMLNNPLVAVWSNSDKIQSSIRKTSKYGSPPVFKSDMSLKTIASGTSTNATHLTYTFLCSKCALPGAKLGWAMSTSPVSAPADVESKLGYHMAGYGTFTVDLEKAKSAGFAGWAATAA